VMSALEGRRTALGMEITDAIAAATAQRADLLGAVEGLRMGMLRLTSGLGRADDLASELAAARALLDSVPTGSGQR